MSPLLAAAFAVCMYLMVRLLHMTQPSYSPIIYVRDRSSNFVQSVLTLCPILNQPYVPPLLWGKSGHAQTFAYGTMGRIKMPVPNGVRHSKVMPDGSTITFDVFEPINAHRSGDSYCLLICPGIGNSSECAYMRTLVNFSQKNGYISVVINHLGALKNVPLTSSRIFCYGGTEELGIVRAEVEKLHPDVHIILVGCSMGANIVVKYLGESEKHQEGILAAMSLCQGYDLLKAKNLLLRWENLRKAYIYVMTMNQKKILHRHQDQILSEQEKEKSQLDIKKIFSATTLEQLDEAYTRRRFGFKHVDDFYCHNSSHHYIKNIRIPLLVMNAEDDPIVPVPLLDCPKEASEVLPNCIFVMTKHGGHLGFYEQGWFVPRSLTWMDRLIIEFANSITVLHQENRLPKPAGAVLTNAEPTESVETAALPDLLGGGEAKKENLTQPQEPQKIAVHKSVISHPGAVVGFMSE